MHVLSRTLARCVPLAFVAVAVVVAACSTSGDGAGPNDVGMANPNGADPGGSCGGGQDCKSGVCSGGSCAAPTSSDGAKNGDETGVDCGGSSTGAPKCATGQGCASGADCAKATCIQNVCKDPTVTDGVKNGSETDVDCGGTGAPACAPGRACIAGTDCTSKICGTDKRCTTPSKTDGVKNGDETDVDCGGSSTGAPKCVVGKACNVHADCGSDACDYKKKCIAIKSCTAQHGGDTCGPGEVAAGHESCCTTIAGSPVDKYNITAGRMRQFVERTNGNMRAFAQGYAGTWWNHSWDQFLPTMLDSGGTDPDFTGVYQELGPVVHPPGAMGANEGCYVAGNGTRTFRLPDVVNTRMKDPQYYTQDVLDEKPLNCTDAYIIAAFCAWDGGRLPTRAEWNAAWGAGMFPWAGTTRPAGWSTAYDSDATGLPFMPADGNVKLANYLYNYWGPATRVATDYSVYIAPPGRFPLGNGPQGHSDLGGSVFNFQEIIGTTVNWSKSGSWQGHQVPYPTLNTAATNKYWATGGRCAR